MVLGRGSGEQPFWCIAYERSVIAQLLEMSAKQVRDGFGQRERSRTEGDANGSIVRRDVGELQADAAGEPLGEHEGEQADDAAA